MQTCINLTIWTTKSPDVETSSSTPDGDGITEMVTARIKPPLSDAGAKKFVRVKVVI